MNKPQIDRNRTQLRQWKVGGEVFTTVHRIAPDGSEVEATLASRSEPVHLELEPMENRGKVWPSR